MFKRCSCFKTVKISVTSKIVINVPNKDLFGCCEEAPLLFRGFLGSVTDVKPDKTSLRISALLIDILHFGSVLFILFYLIKKHLKLPQCYVPVITLTHL